MSLPSLLGLGTVGAVSLTRTDRALMPSVRAQYQLDPRTMVYASYSRGFKAGGFSAGDITAVAGNFPFNPEHVNAYEAGLKSELFDRSLLLNFALFRNDFDALQVSITTAGSSGAFLNFIRNVASSQAQGVEMEAQWLVNPLLRLSVSGSYLDSRYGRYPNAGPTSMQELLGIPSQDLSGQRTPFAPEWSGTVSATLTLPVGDRYRLTAEGIAILSTDYQTYTTLDPLTLQPGYVRIDSRLTFEQVGGRWAIDLIGRNLNNAVVRTFSVVQPLSVGSLAQAKEQGANIAIQGRLSF